MVWITCPYCGANVELIKFGFAWVGICCRGVIYNDIDLPEGFASEGKGGNRARTHG